MNSMLSADDEWNLVAYDEDTGRGLFYVIDWTAPEPGAVVTLREERMAAWVTHPGSGHSKQSQAQIFQSHLHVRVDGDLAAGNIVCWQGVKLSNDHRLKAELITGDVHHIRYPVGDHGHPVVTMADTIDK
jgi:hypothetical protein